MFIIGSIRIPQYGLYLLPGGGAGFIISIKQMVDSTGDILEFFLFGKEGVVVVITVRIEQAKSGKVSCPAKLFRCRRQQ